MNTETMHAIPDQDPVFETTLAPGTLWSSVIGRGKVLRITDLEGGANVATLFYNANEKQERYNMPDTLKGQHVFFLTAPLCIHSDMGRLFCSIVKDSAGWHDTVCGVGNRALVERKYGIRTFQEARNDFYRNGRDCFLIELAKWGMGERDLVPNLNFFSKVTADAEGGLHFDPAAAKAGSAIDLRFEMDSLVVLNTCQHPLDPQPHYAPKPVKLEVFPASAFDPASDPCLNSRPENMRAYRNTRAYHELRF
jgi:urea carboxylase-associated protein 2